jgi:hypothetical protein
MEAGIEYMALMDAARTHLLENSIGCHSSINVLEHIPLIVIRDISVKADIRARWCGNSFCDLSDHFQHRK